METSRGTKEEAAKSQGQVTTRRHRLVRALLEIVVIVVGALVLAMLVQSFLVKPYSIPSASMEPTLMVGDRVLVNRAIYRFRAPRRGEVVVFHSPIQTGEDLIKRVVAVGGDTVEVKDGALYVNGARQNEAYLMDQQIDGAFALTRIPAGSYFMMGDNRNDSADSRVFGPVPRSAILGQAFAIYWPIPRIHGL